ncbi:MAG: ABC transporter substrate binding protein, partial [Oscillospiraceae bacterium]
KNGGFATDGIDYSALGKQTAKMAVKILKGEAEPKNMPVEYLEDTVIYLNQVTADKLGIALPADMVAAADKIIKE